MQQFQVLDEKRYPLCPNTKEESNILPYWRWEHRVTLGRNFREFIIFIDNLEQKLYIEEFANGSLKIIIDDILFEDLQNFAHEKKYLELFLPLSKDINNRI